MTYDYSQDLTDAGIEPSDPMYKILVGVYGAANVCRDTAGQMKAVADRLDRRERALPRAPLGGSWWGLKRREMAVFIAALVASGAVWGSFGYYFGRLPLNAEIEAWHDACFAKEAVKVVDGRRVCTVWLDAERGK